MFLGLPLFLCSLFLTSPFSLSLSLSLSLSIVLLFLPSFLFLMSVSGYSFLFLFCSLLVSFCFVSACCLVLFWIIILDLFCFASFLMLLFSCCFGTFKVLAYLSKTSLSKNWILQKAKMKHAEQKTDIFTRAVRTGVLTNSVFFFFFSSLCFFKFYMLCWKIYKHRGCSKNQQKQAQNKCCVKNWSKVVLKWVQLCCATKLDQFFT